MLPPGLSFNAVSEKALLASRASGMRRSYWDWGEQIAANAEGAFPYTPATNLLYGLSFKEGVNHQEIERLKTFFAKKSLPLSGIKLICHFSQAAAACISALLLPSRFHPVSL